MSADRSAYIERNLSTGSIGGGNDQCRRGPSTKWRGRLRSLSEIQMRFVIKVVLTVRLMYSKFLVIFLRCAVLMFSCLSGVNGLVPNLIPLIFLCWRGNTTVFVGKLRFSRVVVN
jgi:hypothetical protein